jgi:hypothetical protein
MRTRENAQREQELALVTAWLRRRAQLLTEAVVGIAGLDGVAAEVKLPVLTKMDAEAQALRDAANSLEAGEHRP